MYREGPPDAGRETEEAVGVLVSVGIANGVRRALARRIGPTHHADPAGDRARMAAARAFVARFGVASECGWGRTDPQRLGGLLESHRGAAESWRV